MALPIWFEIGSFACLSLILLADLLLVVRRPHLPSMRESAAWVTLYVGLALAFAVALWTLTSHDYATEFVAGWLTEYSLSMDNLFVFILIMSRWKVPPRYQQEVLMIGIILALVFRGLFILAGAKLISSFSWVFYIFGVWLIYVALRQLRDHADSDQDNPLIRSLRRIVPLTNEYHDNHLTVVIERKRHVTPMVLVLVTIGSTDLLFALDSIPAIFGLTNSAFIVFTANIFALMGLRQLYFLLGGLLKRLVYLNFGLAGILGFIGAKLTLHALHTNDVPFINGGRPVSWAPEIPIWLSLAVIAGCLIIATGASLAATARRRSRAASLPQSHADKP
ncbi:MAG: TerC/Alx family metal homeostasis membrane protein [Bifidobacteriaceae bacterium]|jgi:tellurite resistance protein TerC|nr:TerC/Alx family metal homeostasis membrane protein [Bifidobacteriaceae bacterium]